MASRTKLIVLLLVVLIFTMILNIAMLAQKTENAASPSCLERSEIERIQIITVTPAAKTKQMWRDEQNGRSSEDVLAC